MKVFPGFESLFLRHHTIIVGCIGSLWAAFLLLYYKFRVDLKVRWVPLDFDRAVSVCFMATLAAILTKKLVGGLGPGRHGDGNGLYLVVDPSGARRWIVRVTVKGQKNKRGGPLRTDFGLGGADVVTLNQARDRALEYRRMAKQGLNPRFHGRQDVPTFEEIALQVHIDRMPTWKNAKHGQQWINTLRDYAFPKIGRMPVDGIDQPEVLMCLSPIWTEKHETAKRLAQRIKVVLDVAKAKGVRSGENPVTAIKDAGVLPKVVAKPVHHKACIGVMCRHSTAI